MVGEDKDEIYDAGRRHISGPLHNEFRGQLHAQFGWKEHMIVRTDRARTSAGVETLPGASSGRKHVFKMFLMRGASCKLPFVRCKAGTGW